MICYIIMPLWVAWKFFGVDNREKIRICFGGHQCIMVSHLFIGGEK